MTSHQTPSRRLVTLGGPAGWLTTLPAHSPALSDRYTRWTRLVQANPPRRCTATRQQLADELHGWVLRTHELKP